MTVAVELPLYGASTGDKPSLLACGFDLSPQRGIENIKLTQRQASTINAKTKMRKFVVSGAVDDVDLFFFIAGEDRDDDSDTLTMV